jgi:preprotein translocase subunit YajC
MTNISALLAETTASTAKSTTNTGSEAPLLVIVVLLALFYFLFMRPNQRRRMQALRQSRAFEVGDEVVAAGMVGRVVGMESGEVDVEVADGVTIKFVSQAVQSRQAFVASQTRGRPGMRGGGAPSQPGPTRFGPGQSDQGDDESSSWPDAGPADDEGQAGGEGEHA